MLVPLGRTPALDERVRVVAYWEGTDVPSEGPRRAWREWLARPVPVIGRPPPTGLASVVVSADEVVLTGRTCVLPDDAGPLLDAAKTALADFAATPDGVHRTLLRLTTRIEDALADKTGDFVSDTADELRRLVSGVQGLRDAAKAGLPYRPTRGELVGDSRRASRSGSAYRLFVPDSARTRDGARPRPLVVALHGADGSEDTYFEAHGAGEALRLAKRRGWALVAPDDSRASWDVVADVRTFLDVDPARIYLTGHSLGAGAAWQAAMASPDLYAAVACVAGGWTFPSPPTYSDLRRTPILSITASLDFSRGIAERTARLAAEAGVPVVAKVYEDLDHVLVVGASLPEVFAFFDAHARK